MYFQSLLTTNDKMRGSLYWKYYYNMYLLTTAHIYAISRQTILFMQLKIFRADFEFIVTNNISHKQSLDEIKDIRARQYARFH